MSLPAPSSPAPNAETSTMRKPPGTPAPAAFKKSRRRAARSRRAAPSGPAAPNRPAAAAPSGSAAAAPSDPAAAAPSGPAAAAPNGPAVAAPNGPAVAAPSGPAAAAPSRPAGPKRPRKKFFKAPLNRPNMTIDKELTDLLESMTLSPSKNSGGGRDGAGDAPTFTDEVREYLTFEEMELKTDVLKGIYSYGLVKPAKIQQRAIVPMVKGCDAIVQAQSGMGKTAALVIAVLQRLDESNPKCQALIVAPTRELAEQITEVFEAMKGDLKGVFTCIGGKSTKQCKIDLRKGQQIVIGTTGRLAHMMSGYNYDKIKFLDATSIKIFALDEADKLLCSDYKREMQEILRQIPGNAQCVMMSATMPEHILRVAYKVMRKPVRFLMRNDELTLEGIDQYYIQVHNEEGKVEVLSDIYTAISNAQGMIFCNSRNKVEIVKKRMAQREHVIPATSSNLSQAERENVLDTFKKSKGEGGSRMIITSDLLARGIDVREVALVINYDIPIMKEEYIHRVGRGGRYGGKSVAITFVTDTEMPALRALEEFYKTEISEMPTSAVANGTK